MFVVLHVLNLTRSIAARCDSIVDMHCVGFTRLIIVELHTHIHTEPYRQDCVYRENQFITTVNLLICTAGVHWQAKVKSQSVSMHALKHELRTWGKNI